MGFPILVRWHLYIEPATRRLLQGLLSWYHINMPSDCNSYSGNTWLCVHWQWNTLEWCQLNVLQTNCRAFSDTTRQWTHNQLFLLLSYMPMCNAQNIFIYVMKYVCFHFKVGNSFCSLYQFDWWNLKHSATVGTQFLWSRRHGCNKRSLWLRHCDVIHWDKAVSQWLLTFNMCVSVTWPLTSAFHTHTPEITDMHRGVFDILMIPRHPWMKGARTSNGLQRLD